MFGLAILKELILVAAPELFKAGIRWVKKKIKSKNKTDGND